MPSLQLVCSYYSLTLLRPLIRRVPPATYIVSPSEVKFIGQAGADAAEIDCHVGADQLATCVGLVNGTAVETDTMTATANVAVDLFTTTSSGAGGSSTTGLSYAPSGTGSGSQSTRASTSGTAPSATHSNSAVTVGSAGLTSLAIVMLVHSLF
jgi:hypothetical protein